MTQEEIAVGAADSALFDPHGRCIPSGLKSPVHQTVRRYFAIHQPEIDYAAAHARLSKHLGIADAMPAAEFERRAEAILAGLRANPETRKLAEGVRVPFLLPKASHGDIGEAIDTTYLKAVSSAFSEKFLEYRFTNHHKDGLAGKLSIAPGSRHERLVQAMGQGQVVGYFFPCLTEYSIPAAIEQTNKMPQQFLLAGGYDTCAAFVAAPELLLRTDGYPPLIWLAALNAEKPSVGYHFEAYGYNLTFNRRVHFGEAAEYWASGMVVLG